MKKPIILFLIIFIFSGCGNTDEGQINVENNEDIIADQQELDSESESLDNIENTPEDYTIPMMTDEQKSYNDKYVMSLLTSGMIMNSWSKDDTSELLGKNSLMYAYEDIMGRDHMTELWDKYGADLPRKEIEGKLTELFPFSEEQIQESLAEIYDGEKEIYYYEGGRGGGPIESYVSNVTNNEDGSVSLDYSILTGWNDDKQAYNSIMNSVLTIIVTEDSYKYISVKIK